MVLNEGESLNCYYTSYYGFIERPRTEFIQEMYWKPDVNYLACLAKVMRISYLQVLLF